MSGHKIFVGNLPSDLSEDELRVVFNTYGNTTDCHIMAGKSNSGQSCAFVVYDSADGASTAIETLNGVYSFREDGSPPITVSWARQGGGGGGKGGGGGGGGYGGHQSYGGGGYQQSYGGSYGGPSHNAVAPPSGYGGKGGGGGYGKYGGASYSSPPAHTRGGAPQQGTKLFVGNLPADIEQEALRMVFGSYGSVTNIHVMAGKSKSGQSCAFVEYASPTESETAILTLHEKYEIRPGEGSIIVKYASSGGGPRSSPY